MIRECNQCKRKVESKEFFIVVHNKTGKRWRFCPGCKIDLFELEIKQIYEASDKKQKDLYIPDLTKWNKKEII